MTATSDDPQTAEPRGEVIREMGMTAETRGDVLVGQAEIVAEMFVPGIEHVRLSALATWGDLLTGIHAGAVFAPRVGLTLDLDVHLLARRPGTGVVHGVAVTLKRGRSIVVNRAELTAEGEDRPFAVTTATFMASPDPAHVLPPDVGRLRPPPGRLSLPMAERAGVTRPSPGVADVPLREANLNATGAIQGGLIALCAEEAILSLRPTTLVTSMSMRYMRAFRAGPARAQATAYHDVTLFELVDPIGGRVGVTGSAQMRPG
jgi:acyl-coenzyme A thioesterase PaaI-like protein